MAAPDPDSREFRQMRHDVDDVYRLLTVVQETVDSTRETVGTVVAAQWRHDNRFEEIQRALDRQSVRTERTEDNQRRQAERLGRMETRLGGIQESQQEQGERLSGVEGRLEGVNSRLEGVDTRLEGVDTRLEGVDTRLEGVDTRLERMEDAQQEILTLLRGRSS
jgi:chromosome segregation ATPase